jgi:hypothetical protein
MTLQEATMYDTLEIDTRTTSDVAAQASNLDALMTEVSLTAARGTIIVCGQDEADPDLVAVRPLAARGDSQCSDSEWGTHTDAVIFGYLLSP